MSLANPAPASIKEDSLSVPKQVKLLGATVRSLGVITAVSSTLPFCYALIEDAQGVEHRRLLADLKREEVDFPDDLQPYTTHTRRIEIGTWDEVHSLIPTLVDVLAVAA